MTDLAVRSTTTHDPADLARLLGLNPNDPKTQAMVAVCQQYGLDPLLKHVVVIPGSGVYITRDGLLHVAHRSGQLDGIVLESGPTLVDGEWRCVVSVYRKDMSRPFTFPGRYAANQGNRKYAPEMALKVAECMALRRAFDVSGLGVQEEVEAPAGVQQEPRPVQVEVVAETPASSEGGGETTGAEVSEGKQPSAPVHPDTDARFKRMQILLRGRFGPDRPAAREWVGVQVGRAIGSTNDLAAREVVHVVAVLEGRKPEAVTAS